MSDNKAVNRKRRFGGKWKTTPLGGGSITAVVDLIRLRYSLGGVDRVCVVMRPCAQRVRPTGQTLLSGI